jgi:cation transporter-like permease
MIVIIGAIFGAVAGGLLAWRRKGRPADILLYAFVYGLILAIIGLFVTLILHRVSV